MDKSQVPNPYDYRNPVRNAALFVGRAAELATIDYELGQAGLDRASIHIAVHGQRASGKTSLLNRTEHLARERGLLPVRVDLVPGHASASAFFRKVYEEVAEAVMAEGVLTDPVPLSGALIRRMFAGAAPEPGCPLQFPEALALAGPLGVVPETPLRLDLAHFVKSLGRPIALLIDEAQLIAGEQEVLSVLRSLGTRLDGFVFVLAGTQSLLSTIDEVYSPLLRQFTEIKVERFEEPSDIAACVFQPLLHLGLLRLLSEGLRETAHELVRLTDGNPYEIQLYCHEMFARWQTGAASTMALTPDMLEAVRSRMESNRDVRDRALIRAVREMPPERLRAFNVLCWALDRATLDDIWFAYSVLGGGSVTREELVECRAEMIAAGVLADSETVRFEEGPDLFDEIYVRLWTVGRVEREPHSPLLGRRETAGLLTMRLSCLLSELAGGEVRRLSTCCPGMSQEDVDGALLALEGLTASDTNPIPPTVQFLHQAVLKAGRPAALDLTTVTCVYGEYTADRWLYSPDAADYDLSRDEAFLAAAERVAALGGELRIDRVRVPVRRWDELTAWLRKATGPLRADLAENYVTAAYTAYERGDRAGALELLGEAFALERSGQAANNLLYLSLTSGEPDAALTWAEHAVELAEDPTAKALSRYNAAMAHLMNENWQAAAEMLGLAAADVAPLAVPDARVGYLLMPQLRPEGGGIDFPEEAGVDLLAAIGRAAELVRSIAPVPDGPGAGAPGEAGPGADAVAPTASEPQGTSAPAVAGHRAAATAPVVRGPKVVLVVATEWWSAHGGLSTFNRDLCTALAAAGAVVHCVVLSASDAELTAARESGVNLLVAPGAGDVGDDVRLTMRPKLPAGTSVDLVIGHSRITGQAAALLVNHFFEDARRLHFIHMAPDEIEWLKPGGDTEMALAAEDRTETERRLGKDAYRVVTVGPHLYGRFLGELEKAPLRLDPGFDVADGTPRTPPAGSPLKVLVVGRMEDHHLKGLDLAARACGKVAAWRDRERLSRIGLVVRGVPRTGADQQRKAIEGWADNSRLEVVVRVYSADRTRLAEDMGRASIVLMPSRAEGFGLVGLEALTAGVPVLISEASGLAELLREKLGDEVAARVVVPMSGDDDVDAEAWARKTDMVLADLPSAFRRAAELREVLAREVTWADAAASVLAQTADAAPDAPVAPAVTG
ncbi:glycosyltransferase [Streptomyces sp. NPDC047737]|uniref:glycosyltransferase n=1 Tax=unclassified Streptomyces TaxID=2593676 RepID=UPI0033D84B3F